MIRDNIIVRYTTERRARIAPDLFFSSSKLTTVRDSGSEFGMDFENVSCKDSERRSRSICRLVTGQTSLLVVAARFQSTKFRFRLQFRGRIDRPCTQHTLAWPFANVRCATGTMVHDKIVMMV